MKRNEEIASLANEILLDIGNNRTPLHISLLKASRLSGMLDMPTNVSLFQSWAKFVEGQEFISNSFQTRIEAAKDPNISYTGGNQFYVPHSNFWERSGIKSEAEKSISVISNYRAETYKFVSTVYTQYQFGNLAQNIFERKRLRIEPILGLVIFNIQDRLNSIEQNLNSDNEEDWKNAASSCRSVLMDLADKLIPLKSPEDSRKYISRLQGYVNPIFSKTKKKIVTTLLDEVAKRIELTVNYTQGPAHKDRPMKVQAEDVVLYTYLIIGEIAEVYELNQSSKICNENLPSESTKDKK